MHRFSRTFILLLSLLSFQFRAAEAQVLASAEVKDPASRALQEKYFTELKTIANEVKAHSFPYHFYFSRVLDISETREQSSDQRALQFDKFRGQMILKITGNYFASYPAEQMPREERARRTFADVMMPVLQSAVAQFQNADTPDAYGLEISHHIRRKVLGVMTEGFENVVLVLPRQAAKDLVAAHDPELQNAALVHAAAYVDGKPVTFWPSEPGIVVVNNKSTTPIPIHPASYSVPQPSAQLPGSAEAHLTSPKLEERYSTDLARMLRDLDTQAHFVAYAAPAFIDFHHHRYLQLSITTTLSGKSAGSQYQLAALSFDEHVAHLIRPVLSYFEEAQDFDGIDFSTTVAPAAGSGSDAKLAVEYVLPFEGLRKYESYDSTGQELLDSSFVLINGERVGLNLQVAENR